MEAEKIANRQLLFMLFMIRSTLIIATLPVLTTGDAAQDAWASAAIALAGTLLIVFAIGSLSSKFPERTLVEYSRILLGRFVGGLVSLAFLWLFLHIAATDIRIYAEVIVGGFLFQTPLVFIVSCMVLVSALAVYLGIETIGRSADLLVALFSFFVIISFLVGLASLDPKNLEPVLARGIAPVISGALSPIAVGAQFLAIPMLAPSLTAPRKATSTAALAVVIAGAMLVVATVVVVGVLGPHLGSKAVFPLFKMARATMLTRFLERLEAPVIIAWGLGLFIDVSVFLYCGCLGLSQLLGLKDYRSLLGPMSVIWVITAVHGYEDLFDVLRLFRPEVILPYVTAVAFVPYAVLWVAYTIRALLGRPPGDAGGR